MQNFIKELRMNNYFYGFIVLFAYAQSIQNRILVREHINFYTFTPEAAIFTLACACILFLIIRIIITYYEKTKRQFIMTDVTIIFIFSLLLYLFIINILSLAISLAFDTVRRNFNQQTLLSDNIHIAINACIYGSFFVVYFFYKKNKKDLKKLALYNYALSEGRIAQLKAQLNPHFLFNNLNVLDQLIEEDHTKASDFLNDFAELYRYVLQASNKKLVPLEEELFFAKSYFRIMRHKYGEDYKLEIRETKNIKGLIPPLTLQLLIENVIEHNLGSEQNPIWIVVEISNRLEVVNTIALKPKPKPSGGRSLRNLKEQYELLSAETMYILQSETQFSISLPIILCSTV
jgi:sensor histidine kinase YesM